MAIEWPTKESITQTLVTNIIGPGKAIADLSNQWVIKHLIIAVREVVYLLVVVIKAVYDQSTVISATGNKLMERGSEYGVERKEATKAVHLVTLRKSSPVVADLPVPNNFLLTTTPVGNTAPIQFRVRAGQGKFIAAGQSSVFGVQAECTQAGEIGNVANGAINLVAQAGFDSVTDSVLYQAGADIEDEEAYRARILDRKRNPERGGTPMNWKIWAESVEGVVSATPFPRNRGNGTVDILIAGPDGMPSPSLVNAVQAYLDTKTPADMADGAVLVIAPTGVAIDVNLIGCVWRDGYAVNNGGPLVEFALKKYINTQANLDRVVRVVDLIAAAKGAYGPEDPDKKPVLLDFTMTAPVANRVLANTEMALPGAISMS